MKVFLMVLAVSTALAGQVWAAPGPDLEAAQQLMQRQNAPGRSQEQRKVVDAMGDFGLQLHLAHSRANVNLTTSPFSLVSAFGLVLNGAKGSTLAELNQALSLQGLSPSQFNVGYASLREGFKAISRDNILSFGNAIFADRDFVIEDSYLKTVRRYLGAAAENVNFHSPETAAQTINGYIETQTHDMIKKLVDPSSVEGWRTALVNAGYFKGAWAFRFNVQSTAERGKFNTGRSFKTVPMMYQHDKTYLYYQGNGFQMASLAYKNADFAMDVIVPDLIADAHVGEALEQVQSQLTGATYRQAVESARPTKITLALPRFETEFKADLSEYFKAAMPLTFSNDADFSLFSREAVKIDKVIHATVLKVNEEGTEGAFATVVGEIRATSVIPHFSPRVIADRPFILVIRHAPTGTPIFVSTVWDPKPMARPAQ